MFLTVYMHRSTRHQNSNYITCKHLYIILYITNTESLFITSSYICSLLKKVISYRFADDKLHSAIGKPFIAFVCIIF